MADGNDSSGDGPARPEGGGGRRRGRGRGAGGGAGAGGPGSGAGGTRGGQGGRGGGPGGESRGGQGGSSSGSSRGHGGRGSGGQGARGGRGPAGRGPARAGGADQQSPIEVAVRSTRNAIRRHAESLREDDSRLACRSLLTALVAASRGIASPAELLSIVEQVGHVVEDPKADDHQLQVTLRAVAAFTRETPRKSRDVTEMIRLLLRFGYVVASDHLPREFRDDGAFRGSALADQLETIVPEYLSDARFAELGKR